MKRKTFTNFLIIFIILVLIYLTNIFLNLKLGNRLVSLAKPVTTVITEIGSNISGFFKSVGNIGKLQRENRELNEKLNQSITEIARLSEAQRENLSLKKDLGFKTESNYDLVPAKVTSFDPSNIRETITINVGKKDNIKEGMVVVSEGFLVGRIINLDDTTAKIKLINDSESAIPANISGSSISGIVKGNIGSGLSFDQVPQSEKVNMGDYVVTSGLGGDYPKGLIIGKVEDVQKISGSIFQLITLRPMVGLGRLERVMVIKG